MRQKASQCATILQSGGGAASPLAARVWAVRVVCLASLLGAGCASGVTQEEEVEARLAQTHRWSSIKLEEVGDGSYRGTAVTGRGELLKVEVTADERSIEARWKNVDGRGEGSSRTSTRPPERMQRRTADDRLRFWLTAMVVVLVAAANVAYYLRREPKPGEARKPSFLLDFDYPLRGWRGVGVALFYVGLIAVIVLAAAWASKVHNPNWPEKPAPVPPISGPL